VDESFELLVNGAKRVVECEPGTPLLWVLRDHLELFGTKFGCGAGLCGACTVIVENTAVNSCDTPVWSIENKEITTVEGLSINGGMSRLQEEFLACEAAQCGYCTSGMLMRATSFLNNRDYETPSPTRAEVCSVLDANLCRCGIHNRAIEAIVRVGEK
jgi:nicotinate dehydrogenase subunit A